jgi:hypothetical protein
MMMMIPQKEQVGIRFRMIFLLPEDDVERD